MPFEANLLAAAVARRRRDNEAHRLAALEQVFQWLDAEGRQYGIEQAYVFGSVVRPYQFTENSDVDVAVEQIAPECFFIAMADLSERVERDVDLIELRDILPTLLYETVRASLFNGSVFRSPRRA